MDKHSILYWTEEGGMEGRREKTERGEHTYLEKDTFAVELWEGRGREGGREK